MIDNDERVPVTACTATDVGYESNVVICSWRIVSRYIAGRQLLVFGLDIDNVGDSGCSLGTTGF